MNTATLSDHDLTTLVDSAARGVVASAAAWHGGAPWDEMDGMAQNSVREAALPFIFHGTKALAELGYVKPRMVMTPAEANALPDRAAILTPGGIIFRKWAGYYGEGKDAWERELGQVVPAELLSAEGHFPATVLHEPTETKES